ncbi:DUF3810 domain-containing protein [bacterium]|nr:DUF3810 domain-containing protein [bacterium]
MIEHEINNQDLQNKKISARKKNRLKYWAYMIIGTIVLTLIVTVLDIGKGIISPIGTAAFALIAFYMLVKKSKLYFDEDFNYRTSTRKCFFLSCILSWIFVGFIGFILFASKLAPISFVVPTILISPIFFVNRHYSYVQSILLMDIEKRKSEIMSVCIAILITFNVVIVLFFTFHIHWAIPYSRITFVFDLFVTLFIFFSSLQKIKKTKEEKKSLIPVVLIALIGLPFAIILLIKNIAGIAIQ